MDVVDIFVFVIAVYAENVLDFYIQEGLMLAFLD